MSLRMEELSMYIRSNMGPAAVWTSSQRYSIIIRSFLSGVGSDVLRALLVEAASRAGCSVQSFLLKNQTKIIYLILQHKVKHLVLLVYPPDDSDADIQQWDCHLLCLVLRAIDCLDARGQDDLCYIERTYTKHAQNDGGKLRQSVIGSKQQPRPKREWITTCSAIQRLVENTSDTSLLSSVRNFICKVEMGGKTMDARIETHLSLAKMISELAASHSDRLDDEGQALRKHIGDLVKLQQQYDAVSKPSFSTSRSSKNLSRSMVIGGRETRPLSARDKDMEGKLLRPKSASSGISQTHVTKTFKRANTVDSIQTQNLQTNAQRPFSNTSFERQSLRTVSLVTPKLSQPRAKTQDDQISIDVEPTHSTESSSSIDEFRDTHDSPVPMDTGETQQTENKVENDIKKDTFVRDTDLVTDVLKATKVAQRNKADTIVKRPHSFDVMPRNKLTSRHAEEEHNRQDMTQTQTSHSNDSKQQGVTTRRRPHSFDVSPINRSTHRKVIDESKELGVSHESYNNKVKNSRKDRNAEIAMIYSQSMKIKPQNQDQQNLTDKPPFSPRIMKTPTQQSVTEKQQNAKLIVSQPMYSSLIAYTSKYKRPQIQTKDDVPDDIETTKQPEPPESIPESVTDEDSDKSEPSIKEEVIEKTPEPQVQSKSRFGRFKDMLKGAISKKTDTQQDMDNANKQQSSSGTVSGTLLSSERLPEYVSAETTSNVSISNQQSSAFKESRPESISNAQTIENNSKYQSEMKAKTEQKPVEVTNSKEAKRTRDNSENSIKSGTTIPGPMGQLQGMLLNLLPETAHTRAVLEANGNGTETEGASNTSNTPQEMTNGSIKTELQIEGDPVDTKKSSRVRFINEAENPTNTVNSKRNFNEERKRRLSLPAVVFQEKCEPLSNSEHKGLDRTSKSLIDAPKKGQSSPQRRVSIATSSMHGLSTYSPANKMNKMPVILQDQEITRLQPNKNEQSETINIGNVDTLPNNSDIQQHDVQAVEMVNASKDGAKSDEKVPLTTENIKPTTKQMPKSNEKRNPKDTLGTKSLNSKQKFIADSKLSKSSGETKNSKLADSTRCSEIKTEVIEEISMTTENQTVTLVSRKKSADASNIQSTTGKQKNAELVMVAPESESIVSKDTKDKIENLKSNLSSRRKSIAADSFQQNSEKINRTGTVNPRPDDFKKTTKEEKVKIEEQTATMNSRRKSIAQSNTQQGSEKLMRPKQIDSSSELNPDALKEVKTKKGKQAQKPSKAVLSSKQKKKTQKGKHKQPDKTALLKNADNYEEELDNDNDIDDDTKDTNEKGKLNKTKTHASSQDTSTINHHDDKTRETKEANGGAEDDPDAEMKRIANDVIVHHQVHKAAREFMDKDKAFTDEFFSFLHRHKATKEFLKTEQFSPFKTMKLPNGIKAALSFLHAFTFRHVNVFDRDQCNHVVEKILKRTECEDARKVKKEEDEIISRIKAEVKTRKRTPFHSTKLITMETMENMRNKKINSNGKSSQKGGPETKLEDPGNKRPISALKKLHSIAICQCWKCRQKDLAMTIAVNWRNHDLCRLLLSYGIHFKMEHLLPAVRANDADNVKEIVIYLKKRFEWNPENEDAKMALILARFHDMHDIVAFLEMEGVQDERVVQCACFA